MVDVFVTNHQNQNRKIPAAATPAVVDRACRLGPAAPGGNEGGGDGAGITAACGLGLGLAAGAPVIIVAVVVVVMVPTAPRRLAGAVAIVAVKGWKSAMNSTPRASRPGQPIGCESGTKAISLPLKHIQGFRSYQADVNQIELGLTSCRRTAPRSRRASSAPGRPGHACCHRCPAHTCRRRHRCPATTGTRRPPLPEPTSKGTGTQIACTHQRGEVY
jgi:hypothetical protein